jgi:sterol 3beta-glucosyltransferase
MHFGIFTYGSRGDVQPYVALALGLVKNGHEVTLAAPENFKGLVEGYGINFHALHGNAEEIIYTPECLKIIHKGNDVDFMRYLSKILTHIREPLLRDLLACAAKVDALIVNNLGANIYAAVAEKLGKKMLIVQLNPPIISTGEFAVTNLSFINWGWYNRMTYRLVNAVLWQLIKKSTVEFRKMLELPPLKRSIIRQFEDDQIPVIHAFSNELINRPADWQSHYSVVGFLTVPAGLHGKQNTIVLSPDLIQWLKQGEKPVYIGFGSIPVPDANKLGSIISHILTTTNNRIVFCEGWSHIPNLPVHPNLFVVHSTDHQWLLPQCKAAVIHGGIGTLAAVLKAGVPVIIVSIFVDQPIWGNLIANKKKKGLHLPWSKLTADRLVNAIDLATQPNVVSQAALMAQNINRENGVENAVKIIESYFQN